MSVVTFKVSANDFDFKRPFIEVGQLVRIKQLKRIWGKVKSSSYDKATLVPVYRPSPKSNLNKKSIFSKSKGEIIPMTFLS